MTRFSRPSPRGALLPTILIVAAAIFVADLKTALGIAVWVLYLAPTALAFFGWQPMLPVLVAGACTVLTVIGYFGSPAPVVAAWLPPVNRGIGIGAMWALAAIGQSFIRSKLALKEQEWLRTAESKLSRRIEGNIGVDEIASAAVRFLAPYVEAAVGVVHVRDDEGRYRRSASYALGTRSAASDAFGSGEGIGGQAALERRTIVVRDLQPGYLEVESSVGRGAAAAVVASPVTIGDEVFGVLQLGFAREPYRSDIDLLELVSSRLAAAVRSAIGRERVTQLLAETQRQAEELEAQSEELRATNDELQVQGNALRESQARLEEQHAELEQTNTQLAEQATELERKSEDLERSERELHERAAELQRANRYKSEFLANMSHELRTPLNSALILAKLLADNREGNLTAEQVRFARNIHEAGNELLTLINDILDLSKIEAGRIELHAERVPVVRLVEQIATTFGPVASQRQLRFEQVVDARAPVEIETDRQRLLQILQNLLSNAFKFTERGGVTFEIGDAGDGRLSFRVRDTGIGIPEDKQAIIFEAFRQADGTTSASTAGRGSAWRSRAICRRCSGAS